MCLSPIHRSYVNYLGQRKSVACPCGKCLECVRQYQNDWSYRLSAEACDWEYTYFITLTYDNEHLPLSQVSDLDKISKVNQHLQRFIQSSPDRLKFAHNPSNEFIWHVIGANGIYADSSCSVPCVVVEHIQLYIKRLREDLRRKYNHKGLIKFFSCSEYGPQTFRPHYHLLIFSHLPQGLILPLINDKWKFGEVKSKKIDYDHNVNGDITSVAGYVSKYVCKPYLFESPWVNYDCVPRPFRLMSKGIGLRYIKELVIQYTSKFVKSHPNLFIGLQDDGKPLFSTVAKSSIYNLHLTKKHLEFCEVVNKCFVYMRKNQSGKQYFFRIPRYYQNYLFPLRKFQQRYYDIRTKTIRQRTVSRLDSESSLYRLYKDYILALYVERNRILALEKCKLKNISFDGALLEVEQDLRQRNTERYANCLQSFERYYGKHFTRSGEGL